MSEFMDKERQSGEKLSSTLKLHINTNPHGVIKTSVDCGDLWVEDGEIKYSKSEMADNLRSLFQDAWKQQMGIPVYEKSGENYAVTAYVNWSAGADEVLKAFAKFLNIFDMYSVEILDK